jgi:hypothetical protein
VCRGPVAAWRLATLTAATASGSARMADRTEPGEWTGRSLNAWYAPLVGGPAYASRQPQLGAQSTTKTSHSSHAGPVAGPGTSSMSCMLLSQLACGLRECGRESGRIRRLPCGCGGYDRRRSRHCELVMQAKPADQSTPQQRPLWCTRRTPINSHETSLPRPRPRIRHFATTHR